MFWKLHANALLAQQRSTYLLLLTVVCLATNWFGLASTRLWDRDEPRNARCAVEMLEMGNWIVPTFNGQLRTHKPILLYWEQMVSLILFGENDFAVRLPSAVMATLTIFLTFWLASKLADESWAFWSAASLSTCLMFVVASRAATPDASLIAMSTLAVTCFALHWQTQRSSFTLYCVMGHVALGLAMLAKGPVGIVLPLLVISLWAMLQLPGEIQLLKRIYQILHIVRRLRLLPGFLITIAVAAPWYVLVGIQTNGEWLQGFFLEHNFGRAVAAMEGHQGGWWFYPMASLVGLFPWSLMLIPIMLWIKDEIRIKSLSPAIQLGIVWMSVYIVVFSFAKTKLPSYITPCYPGAALLIGGFLSSWSRSRTVLTRRWISIASLVHLAIGVTLTTGIVFLSQAKELPNLVPHSLWCSGLVIVAALMMASLVFQSQQHLPKAMLACSVIMIFGLFTGAASAVGKHRNDLNAILTQSQYIDSQGRPQRTEWKSLRTIEPSWVYYLGTPIEELAGRNDSSLTWPTSTLAKVATALRQPSGRVVIAAEDYFEIEKTLAQRHQVAIREVVSFQPFLKDEWITVIQGKTLTTARSASSTQLR